MITLFKQYLVHATAESMAEVKQASDSQFWKDVTDLTMNL